MMIAILLTLNLQGLFQFHQELWRIFQVVLRATRILRLLNLSLMALQEPTSLPLTLIYLTTALV
ncbi:MAG: hypothetical protein EA392_10370 [Cryomorphaceae bacterium]|nr:MAG: hypothetical protein EA392_10370 [Cryomorphaceae bacterium]